MVQTTNNSMIVEVCLFEQIYQWQNAWGTQFTYLACNQHQVCFIWKMILKHPQWRCLQMGSTHFHPFYANG